MSESFRIPPRAYRFALIAKNCTLRSAPLRRESAREVRAVHHSHARTPAHSRTTHAMHDCHAKAPAHSARCTAPTQECPCSLRRAPLPRESARALPCTPRHATCECLCNLCRAPLPRRNTHTFLRTPRFAPLPRESVRAIRAMHHSHTRAPTPSSAFRAVHYFHARAPVQSAPSTTPTQECRRIPVHLAPCTTSTREHPCSPRRAPLPCESACALRAVMHHLPA